MDKGTASEVHAMNAPAQAPEKSEGDFTAEAEASAIVGVKYFFSCTKVTKDFNSSGGDMLFLLRNLAVSSAGNIREISKGLFQDLVEKWAKHNLRLSPEAEMPDVLNVMEGLYIKIIPQFDTFVTMVIIKMN